MRNARSLMAGAVVLLSSVLAWGCGGTKLVPCKGSTCNAVAGTYAVISNQIAGSCAFTPYTLGASVVVTQSSDLTQVGVGIVDQVSLTTMELRGPLYAPDSSTSGSLGSISMSSQAARLATRTGSDMVNLQITLSAAITKDKTGAVTLSGSLVTTGLPSGTSTKSCTATVSFSATRS